MKPTKVSLKLDNFGSENKDSFLSPNNMANNLEKVDFALSNHNTPGARSLAEKNVDVTKSLRRIVDHSKSANSQKSSGRPTLHSLNMNSTELMKE